MSHIVPILELIIKVIYIWLTLYMPGNMSGKYFVACYVERWSRGGGRALLDSSES